jgi:hypothetical protein
MDRQKEQDPPQSAVIIEGHRQGLGLAQSRQDAP